MTNKRFVPKLMILELIDEMEIVEVMTLVNHLDMAYAALEPSHYGGCSCSSFVSPTTFPIEIEIPSRQLVP
jgi:hypothetical protein